MGLHALSSQLESISPPKYVVHALNRDVSCRGPDKGGTSLAPAKGGTWS